MVYRQTARSERVRAAARERILRAARKLFAKKGFEATTMQHIVKAAGTSIGNLYFYFSNKEELLKTLVGTALTAAWSRGDDLIEAAPIGPARLAVMVFTNVLGLAIANREVMRVMFESESQAHVRDFAVELNLHRVRTVMTANLPDYPEQIDLAAAAWSGAGRGILEQWVKGRITGDAMALATGAARWGLRAMKIKEREIEEAIAIARRLTAPLLSQVAR